MHTSIFIFAHFGQWSPIQAPGGPGGRAVSRQAQEPIRIAPRRGLVIVSRGAARRWPPSTRRPVSLVNLKKYLKKLWLDLFFLLLSFWSGRTNPSTDWKKKRRAQDDRKTKISPAARLACGAEILYISQNQNRASGGSPRNSGLGGVLAG